MRPVFLHSAFRSGSTYLWSRFRACADVCAYYEPFHEVLATITPDELGKLRPDSWNSGHAGLSAPYFAEYAPLLRPENGVALFAAAFTWDDFFLPLRDEEPLIRYIRSLVDQAIGQGRTPVFGFCRSLGRVAWFRQHVPGLQVVTVRDPFDQWLSVITQRRNGNPYFVKMLACVREQALRRPQLAPLFSAPVLPENELDTLARDMSESDALRLFLRCYAVQTALSVPYADLVLELTRAALEPDYRAEAERELVAASGLATLRLDDCRTPTCGPGPDFTLYAETLDAECEGLGQALRAIGDPALDAGWRVCKALFVRSLKARGVHGVAAAASQSPGLPRTELIRQDAERRR